jgi:uncharacterized membrane protein
LHFNFKKLSIQFGVVYFFILLCKTKYFLMRTNQFRRPSTTFILALLSGLCVCLLFVRISVLWSLGYIFLIWNLFLAWIPLWTVLLCGRAWQHQRIGKGGLLLGLAVWLLFFPNAPYLITDLVHLRGTSDATLWFDALLIFSFALAGLLTGLYSLLWVQRLVVRSWGAVWAWIGIPICLILAGYGVYLGRFGRWNSWDILSNPLGLVRYIVHSFVNPLAIQTTLAFSLVLLLTYAAFSLFSMRQEQQV